MPYRLIAIDLNGTLFQARGVVSRATGQALQRAAAHGLIPSPAAAAIAMLIDEFLAEA